MEPKPKEELCSKSDPPLNEPYEIEYDEDEFDEYMEDFNPFLALAIKHYNKKIRDDKGQEYRFSHLTSTGPCRQTYYGELGILCHLFWEAEPKTPGAKIIMRDSSTEDAKIFYARVHEMPNNIHVSYCGIYTESVEDSESCEICSLHSSEEFRKKAQELEAGQEKKEKPILKAGLYPLLIPFSMCPDYQPR
ncbi:hypothetical protein PIB30_016984 [Stylosanthes scabra]|uniref:Uncharacterized protein n=1 Tax=Stylosanthes scabra TaxID=79078 RepID=A0ABU6Z459_9FABA|nr:hypothetical protein [Stylosanthes scabra]